MTQYRILLVILLWIVSAGCRPTDDITAVPLATTTPTEEPFFAPDFTATALSGATYTLSEQRGQWVILNFWATWCVPCVEEMPALQAIANNFADNLLLLGLNVGENADAVRAFVDQHDIRFPILVDVDAATRMNYQVMGLPQTVVIAPNGEIVWRQFGPVEIDSFSALLRDLMR